MRALIVYGTKNGSTKEISERISQVLAAEGFEVRTANAGGAVNDPQGFDIVIVGSAIRLRSWLKAPVRFVQLNRMTLSAKPVWLFSSGLQVNDPRSTSPRTLAKFQRAIGPCEHRFFAGSLDPRKMGRVHRFILGLPGFRSVFPTGDRRDWQEIEGWARDIASSTRAVRSNGTPIMQSDPAKAKGPSGTGRGAPVMD